MVVLYMLGLGWQEWNKVCGVLFMYSEEALLFLYSAPRRQILWDTSSPKSKVMAVTGSQDGAMLRAP